LPSFSAKKKNTTTHTEKNNHQAVKNIPEPLRNLLPLELGLRDETEQEKERREEREQQRRVSPSPSPKRSPRCVCVCVF
jgi:hypothetical protein